MKFKSREEQGVIIIELKGNILGGPDASTLNEQLHQFIDAGKKKIVVDLGQVTFMNSSGLGMLIGGLTTMKNAGGDMRLARPNERVENLLTITKLFTVFQCFGSIEAAVASFV
jgi:anti-sigma B factor antagonist